MVVHNFLTVYVLTDRKYEDFQPFWPRTENGKSEFPGARWPDMQTKLPRYPGWLSPTFLCFTFWPTRRPRAGNRKIWGFRPFWPRTAVGTWRNPGPGPKSEKNTNFRFKGSRNGKAKLLRYPGCPQLVYISGFGRPDAQGRQIAKCGDFWPFWPRTPFGTWRNPGRRLKTEKLIFPAPGVPKSKKKSYHAIQDGCPQLFYGLSFA